MEGSAGKPPLDEAPKKSSMKMWAIIVVVILLVAVVAAVVLMSQKSGSATASFTVSSSAATTNQALTFDASKSTATGTINNYTWNFGDGTIAYGTTATITHAYSVAGKYLALLTVKDDKGNSGTNWGSMVAVDVSNPDTPAPVGNAANSTAPYAVAAVDNDAVLTSTLISFDGTSCAAWSYEKSGSAYKVLLATAYVDTITWNFGDGSATVSGNVSAKGLVNHTYTGDGSIYKASVTVKSIHATANESVYCLTVVVYPKDYKKSGNVVNPDTFVSVTIGDPRSLDPAYDYETGGGEILQNVYETLVFYEGSSASVLKPVLATAVPTVDNGGISADGKTYTFHIRSGVKFHDGNTMKPEDVAYSISRVLTMNHPAGPAWMLGQVLIPNYYSYSSSNPIPASLIAQAITYDNANMTVTFHLTTQYPGFIYCMAFTVGSVVEKSWASQYPDVAGQRNAYLDRHEMGTGPFTLVKWASKQYIQMDRFDAYWQTPAALKHVLIKQISSEATREMLLISGDADAVYIDPQYRNDVRGYTSILSITEGLPTFNVDFIGLCQDIKSGGPAYGDIPTTFFSDIHVRNAFVAAFDYGKYTQDIMQNTSVQPNGVIPIGMFGYDASISKYVYNETKVIAELKLANDTRAGAPAGSSYWDNGFTIYRYYNEGNNARRDGCRMIASALENASRPGHPITVHVESLEWTAFLDANDAGQLPMLYIGWAPDYADPDDYVNPFLLSSGLYGVALSINDSHLDSMVISAASELNTTARLAMYHNITQYCYEQALYLWTSQATNFHVQRNWVNGYFFNPMFSGYVYYNFSKG